jgi:hypothetical protein
MEREEREGEEREEGRGRKGEKREREGGREGGREEGRGGEMGEEGESVKWVRCGGKREHIIGRSGG